MKQKIGIGSKFYMGLIYCFLYMPIVVLIVFSFNEGKTRGIWTGFSLKWYGQLFGNSLVISSLMNTLLIAAVAAIFSTLIGTMAAVGMYSMSKRHRIALTQLSYIAIVSPEIVVGVSLRLLYVKLGIPFGLMSLILSHITFCIPYVILNVIPKLQQMDVHLYEAAEDLGCNSFQAFRKAVIPEIRPGIISGGLMALTYSIDDFVISYFTSGSKAQTLPITIYSMTRRRISPEINALSTIMFFVILLILLFVNIRGSKKQQQNL